MCYEYVKTVEDEENNGDMIEHFSLDSSTMSEVSSSMSMLSCSCFCCIILLAIMSKFFM